MKLFNETGSKPPLIVAPTIGGSSYARGRSLAAELGEDQPIVALDRLQREGLFLADLSEMAEIHLRQLEDIGIDDAFHLVGTSFGAQLCYKIATLMDQAGKTPGQILLVDDDADVHRRRFGIEKENHALQNPIAAGRRAVDRNMLEFFSGKVTLIKAEHWLGERQPGAASDWDYLASGGVDVFEFPCTHTEIWQTAWVSQLAGVIKQSLGSDDPAPCPAHNPLVHHPSRRPELPDAAITAFRLSKQGDLNGEVEHYESVRNNLPEWALINLASAYRQRGQIRQAIEVLEQAAGGMVRPSNSHFELARIYAARNNSGASRTLASRVSALQTLDASDFQALGNILHQCKDTKGAEAAYREAIALDPVRTECHRRCTRLFVDTGRLPEAVALLEEAIDAQPQVVFLKEELAEMLVKSGHDDRAETILQDALDQDPNRPKAAKLLGGIYTRRRKFCDAIVVLGKAADTHKGNIALKSALADVHLAKDDPCSALECFQDIVTINESFVPGWLGLSNVLQKLGREEQAITALLGVPVYLRSNTELRCRISELLFSLHDKKQLDLCGTGEEPTSTMPDGGRFKQAAWQ
ncbi:tetratricopeptide repeat protein [Ruegeria aquimaris]|uniref:Tetratricopeptide repeat protein n=1 Tax=Ruegeria aquimaris TaxID=2984333 RepID=A0ABT3AQD5_9RHOB|nr:tetratricopeptide repeat protein [Ruegeria sp. XHP0148]MCV2890792.1 tetratricopeptide repeat protein [Ruegeria sp. XHP0148]